MAVAFDSVGPTGGAGSGGTSPRTYTHTTVAASTVVVVGASVDNVAVGATVTCTLGGVAMTSLGQVAAGAGGTTGIAQAWYMTGVAAGAHTIVVTCAASSDVEAGSMAYSGAGQVGAPFTAQSATTGTTASVAVATNTSGNMIAGFVACGDVVNSTTQTSRWVANTEGAAGHATGNASGADAAATGSTVTMSWGINLSPWAVIAVEVQPTQPPPSGQGPGAPAPGWQPGTPAMPGGTPFAPWPPWNPVSPPVPPLVVPPEPGPPPAPPMPPAAIGLPGMPGGEPFTPWPPPVAAVKAAAKPYVAGLSGTGTAAWFIDQHGTPTVWWMDETWGLPANAGRWNGGNWRADYDSYHATRASQGLLLNHTHPWGHTLTGCNNDLGKTWDGLFPFAVNGTDATLTGQAGTVTLSTGGFWTRIDYMFASAADAGMTIAFNLSMNCDMPSGAGHGFTNGVFQNASDTQIQTASQLIATRYASTLNLVWMFGDDYYNDGNTSYTAMRTGIAAADSRVTATTSIEMYPAGATSRHDLSSPGGTAFPWGASYATFNWTYYYAQLYYGIETAYADASPIPVVFGDGMMYGEVASGAATDRAMRNEIWWALASGARGCMLSSHLVHKWENSTAAAGITTEAFFTTVIPAVTGYFETLPGWWKLIPDTASAFVTAGRGTRAGYSTGEWGDGSTGPPSMVLGSDNYVAASIAPDGSLAVIYCAAAMSITIDQTKLGTGYTATWVDPSTCATTTATPGSTYNSSGLGNNSAGFPDWVLVLQGPPLAETSPSLELSGFGTFPAIGAADTIAYVQVQVGQFQSSAPFAAAAVQLWDGTSAQIGPTVTGADTTNSGNVDTFTFTGVSYAQLATLRVRIYGNSGAAAPGATQSVDFVSLSVGYIPAAGGTVVTAVLATGAGTAQNPAITTAASVTAVLASGTGAAQGSTPAIGASAVLATGAGTAQNPAITTAVSVTAVLASGTGTAQGPAVAVAANAALATGAGAAQGANPAIGASAGLATGAGTAQNATVTAVAQVTAVLAAGTGTALAASPAITVSAGLASGTGAALNATVSTAATGTGNAVLASGTGTAQNASVTAVAQVTAVLATGTGTAQSANPAIAVSAGQAGGTGAAQNATVSTAATGTGNAGLATGTGTTQSANPAIAVSAGLASGTGAAQNASGTAVAQAAAVLATGTGTAQGANPAIAVSAGLATGTGAAQNPSAVDAAAVTAVLATGAGTAQNATVSTAASGTANAVLASGAGTVQNPAVTAIAQVTAVLATGTGTAQGATPVIGVSAGLATGAGTAQNASVTAVAQVTAGLATGAGTAQNATASTASSGTANAVLATGAGTAQAPAAAVAVTAGLATGTGAAPGPAAVSALTANAGLAAGTGTAQNASVTAVAQVTALLATGAGTALNATASTAAFTNAQAGLASGTGAALNATDTTAALPPVVLATGAGTAQGPSAVIAITVTAVLASGTGTARNPGRAASAGLAAGTALAQAPVLVLATIAAAQAATALAAALQPLAVGTAATIKGHAVVTFTDTTLVTTGVTRPQAASATVTESATVQSGVS